MSDRAQILKQTKEKLEYTYSQMQDPKAKALLRPLLDRIYAEWNSNTAMMEDIAQAAEKIWNDPQFKKK